MNALLQNIANPNVVDVGAQFRQGKRDSLADALLRAQLDATETATLQKRSLLNARQQMFSAVGTPEYQAQIGKYAALDPAGATQLHSIIRGIPEDQLRSAFRSINLAQTFKDPEQQNQALELAKANVRSNPVAFQIVDSLQKMAPAQRSKAMNQMVKAGQQMGMLEELKAAASPPAMQTMLQLAGYKPGSDEYKKIVKDYYTKKGGTTVNLPGAESSFMKYLGKEQATAFVEHQEKAKEAGIALEGITQARKLLNQGMITGFGANFKIGLGKALQEIGYSAHDDAIANTEAFTAAQAKQVASIIKAFGAGTGLSDADREFATKAAGGDITMTEAAIRKILLMNEYVSKLAINRYNEMANALPKDALPFATTIVPDGVDLDVDNDPRFAQFIQSLQKQQAGLADKAAKPSDVVIVGHSKFGDVKEEDIQHTMKTNNMTREQVMELLKE